MQQGNIKAAREIENIVLNIKIEKAIKQIEARLEDLSQKVDSIFETLKKNDLLKK